ncbi:MAG: CBS domain-containing protein [Magnetococcales bacterium]|nr:CBS domain-containing protein [Magnetococcales bacterium]MBF0438984.1 CBS domain-containing protein [Magnetococcales bacterium]
MDSENDAAPLLTSRIRDLDLAKPIILDGVTPIRDVALHMRSRKVDVVLVRQENRHGLVTSADIRDALALSEYPVNAPIAEITSWNLVTADLDDPLFKALLLMTKREVGRLVIGSSEQVEATLELTELLSFLTNHATLTIQRIQQAGTMAELVEAVNHQGHMVNSLISKGVKVRHIGRLVRELDQQVMQKVANLLAPPGLLDHVCIVVMGSEGRGEQIIKTDQDNALIAEDGYAVKEVTAFRQAFTTALLELGYPSCPGNVMMCNDQWGGGVTSCQQRILSWIRDPEPNHLLQLAICFDARSVVGNASLFHRVRGFFMDQLPSNPTFYAHFAMPTLNFDTPLGMFKRFIVGKGSKKGKIDLKKGGIFPIVHGMRSLALEHRLRDPNTVRRIRGLMRKGVIERSFGEDLIETFGFISGLRAKGMMEQLEFGGQSADDYLDLNTLGRLDRENLRDSLALVDDFKHFISHHFRLKQLQ